MAGVNFLFKSTDQLATISSDFPEYSPGATLERFKILSHGVEAHRVDNILQHNLERLFAGYRVPGATA